MPLKINIGDSWKDVKAVKINIGDTWKDVKSMKINIGDTWKDVVIVSGWDIGNASYDGISYYLNDTVSSPWDLFFNSDGTKMYVSGGSSKVGQYSLSTAWNISTASHDFTEDFGTDSYRGIFFKPDGTKMYVANYTDRKINQWTLLTPWDVSTASNFVQSPFLGSQSTYTTGVAFNSDGTIMWVLNEGNSYIYQYSLSTAWDVSTASYNSKKFNPAGSYVNGFFVKPDGTKFYVTSYGDDDRVYQHSVSTPWDLSTASYDGIYFSTINQDQSPFGVYIGDNGKKMYLIGRDNNRIYQYSL